MVKVIAEAWGGRYLKTTVNKNTVLEEKVYESFKISLIMGGPSNSS